MVGQEKRQRLNAASSAKPQRRLQGALKSLPDMPIDIICQIFYLLNPIDLLRITRTNKAFRSLLMVHGSTDQSYYASTSIWKHARKNVQDLPEPFPNMSEPFFASLCFESRCTLCSKPGIQDVIWEFRARLCNECKKSSTMQAIYCLNEIWIESITLPIITVRVGFNGRTQNSALKSDVEHLMEKWKKIEEGDRDAFIQECKQTVKNLQDHASRCRKWLDRVKAERSEEIEAIKENRYKAIYDRLEELGHGPDIYWTKRSWMGGVQKQRLERMSVVRQPRPLTERGWQKICPIIINHIITQIRPLRIKHDYKGILDERVDLLKEASKELTRAFRCLLPPPGDLARISEVKKVLEPIEGNEYPTLDNLVKTLERSLFEIDAQWKDDCRNEWHKFLVQKLSSKLAYEGNRDSGLAIATPICSHCEKIIPASDLEPVFHECRSRPSNPPDDKYDRALHDLELYPFCPSNDFIILSEQVSRILEACDRGPFTTIQKMDELDHRFVCTRCLGSHRIRQVYNWRSAVAHDFGTHSGPSLPSPSPVLDLDPFPSLDFDWTFTSFSWDFYTYESEVPNLRPALIDYTPSVLESPSSPSSSSSPGPWSILPQDEAQKIEHLYRAAEDKARESQEDTIEWRCCHCDESIVSRAHALSHANEEHHIDDPDERDIYPYLDQPIPTVEAIYIVPDKHRGSLKDLPEKVQEAFELGQAIFDGDL